MARTARPGARTRSSLNVTISATGVGDVPLVESNHGANPLSTVGEQPTGVVLIAWYTPPARGSEARNEAGEGQSMADLNGRQAVKFDFFKVDPAWRRLPDAERSDDREEFAAVVDELSTGMTLRTYSLVGLRADADLLLWKAAGSLEQLQETSTRLWSTGLGRYLSQPYSYLSLTRKSQYVGGHKHAGQEGRARRCGPPATRRTS